MTSCRHPVRDCSVNRPHHMPGGTQNPTKSRVILIDVEPTTSGNIGRLRLYFESATAPRTQTTVTSAARLPSQPAAQEIDATTGGFGIFA